MMLRPSSSFSGLSTRSPSRGAAKSSEPRQSPASGPTPRAESSLADRASGREARRQGAWKLALPSDTPRSAERTSAPSQRRRPRLSSGSSLGARSTTLTINHQYAPTNERAQLRRSHVEERAASRWPCRHPRPRRGANTTIRSADQ